MFLAFQNLPCSSRCLLVLPKNNLLGVLTALHPHQTWLSDPSPSRLQCSFWNRQSMFPGEKRAATLFRFRHNIPTRFYVPIAKTPCPSLTLQSCPARLQQTPTPDRYQGQMFGSRVTQSALKLLHEYMGVSAEPAQGLHRRQKLEQPQNSHSLPIQRQRRPKRYRGEAQTAEGTARVRKNEYCSSKVWSTERKYHLNTWRMLWVFRWLRQCHRCNLTDKLYVVWLVFFFLLQCRFWHIVVFFLAFIFS